MSVDASELFACYALSLVTASAMTGMTDSIPGRYVLDGEDCVNSAANKASDPPTHTHTPPPLQLNRSHAMPFLHGEPSGMNDTRIERVVLWLVCTWYEQAYEQSLKKYHGFMVKGIFSMAMSVVPQWTAFVTAVRGAGEDTEDQIVQSIKDFGASLEVDPYP